MEAHAQLENQHQLRIKGRFAERLQIVPVQPGRYNVVADGTLRFFLEEDGEWPAQWKLFPVANEEKADSPVAVENTHWDVIALLERGQFWLPKGDAEPSDARPVREAKRTRWTLPQYLTTD